MYGALRVAVGGNAEVVSQLFQTFILDAEEGAIQADLLFVYPEVKLHDPVLFLNCVKVCAATEDADTSFAGVMSSVVCDLPPDKDEDTIKYIHHALALFSDEVWLEHLEDCRLMEITGGLFSLASILLNVDAVQSVLAFAISSFEQRQSNVSVVRLLATPYTIWRHETDALLPGLREVYETQLRTVDSSAPISPACEDFKKMIFEDECHLRMKMNPRVVEKQTWRAYRALRRDRRIR